MSNRPAIPSEIVRKLLIECGHRCAVCGCGLPLERAHIIPWHKTKTYKFEDMICLCANCHERADHENWDEKTLREYKSRPWVMRHYEKSENQSLPTANVVILIENLPFKNSSERLFRFALAAFLEIAPDDIRIVSVEEGSIKIMIELPMEYAHKLVEAFNKGDSSLREYLAPLEVRTVRLTQQNSRAHEALPESLDELVHQAQIGDRRCKEKLFYRLNARFRQIVKHKIPKPRDKEAHEYERDINDIIQNAFVVVNRKLSYLEFEAFLSWASRVLHHLVGNYIRTLQRAREKLVPLTDDDSSSVLALLGFQGIEDNILLQIDLQNALRSLGNRCRQIFEILVQGGTREDILNHLHPLTPSAVDARIHRCREKLKDKLRKGGFDL